MKKIISVTLVVFILVGLFSVAAFAAKPLDLPFPRLAGPTQAANNHWGPSSVTCLNGRNTLAIPALSYSILYAMDSSYTKQVYCIEPGVDLGYVDSASNVDSVFETMCNNRSTKASEMSADRFATLLKLILANGYIHDGSSMVNWDVKLTSDYNNNDAHKLAKALATQVLLWELVVGERDSNFAICNAHDYGNYSNAFESYSTQHPLYGLISSYRTSIANAVSSVISGINSAASFNGKTYSLERNDTDMCVAVTIDDPSGVLSNVTCSDSSIKTSYNDKKLKIYVPFSEVKEGTYTVSYKYSYSTANVTIYSGGGQDMACVSGSPVTVSSDFSFSIKVPSVHVHKYLPHYTEPTCTTEGKLCYVCTCGVMYTQEIIAPTGHDYTNSAWVITQQPTCTTKGEEKQLCHRCGYVINSREVSATQHDSGVWKIDIEPTVNHEGQKTKYCTKCGEALATETITRHIHVEGYKSVLRAATCTEAGLEGTFCKVCNACYASTEIPASHSSELVWTTSIAAGCTTKGEKAGHCKICGEILETEEIEATGHSDSTWVTSVEASCTTKGEKVLFCQACGKITDTCEIPALGHDDGVWTISKDATCELAGEEICSCTRCGNAISNREIPAIGHDDGVLKVDYEATPEHDGQMTRYCSTCGMAIGESETFSLHSHEKGYEITTLLATCTRNGEKGIVCSVCNAVYSTEAIAASGHEYGDFYSGIGYHSKVCNKCRHMVTENCTFTTTTVEPTCTQPGYSTHVCDICSYTYTDGYKDAIGHKWSKWSNVDKMTHVRNCDCGAQEFALHNWGDYLLNGDGDCFDEGTMTRVCECGATQSTYYDNSDSAQTYRNGKETFLKVFNFLRKVFSLLLVFLIGTY